MEDPDTAIRQAWSALAGPGHDAVAEMIVHRHAEVHRRYHTATHVMWVLRHVDELLAHESRHPDAAAAKADATVDAEANVRAEADADAVRTAALFHDIVYDPRSTTNERDSADIAVGRLAHVGWSDGRLELVHRLIVATAAHDATGVEAAILLDADLAVLGSGADAYRTYVEGVRFEYAFVTDADWRVGRARVLSTFLDREWIYATATMRAAREQHARANLASELADLSA